MNSDIVLRLLWTLCIILSSLFAYWMINRFILRRVRRGAASIEGTQAGKSMILYFTTPDCAPCKTVQRPAIQRVRELLGDQLQVVEVDATLQPEVASHWGVLSVPTTFIIDRRGQPRHVNHGVTTAEKLLKQLENL